MGSKRKLATKPAPARRGEPRWWEQRRLGTGSRGLLTGLAGRLFSQAGKGRGVGSWFLGRRSRQGFRRLPSLAHPIRDDQLPEQCQEQELVDQGVAYHLILSSLDRTEVCYLFSELMNYGCISGTERVLSRNGGL
jgi:hypothetical protein